MHDYTIGVEFGYINREVRDRDVRVHIWDTAGQEVFQSITRSYYQKTAIVFLVYDITNRYSFYHLPRWVDEIRKNAGREVMVVVVGNKRDKGGDRQIPESSGREFAEGHGFLFIETSSRTRNDMDLLDFVLPILMDKIESGVPCDGVRVGTVQVPSPPSNNTCCKIL